MDSEVLQWFLISTRNKYKQAGSSIPFTIIICSSLRLYQSLWHLCTHISSYSLVIIVTGIQVTISFLGRGRLDNYVGCLEESLREISNVPVNLTNSPIPVSWWHTNISYPGYIVDVTNVLCVIGISFRHLVKTNKYTSSFLYPLSSTTLSSLHMQ